MINVFHSGNSWRMISCAWMLLPLLRGCVADIPCSISIRSDINGKQPLKTLVLSCSQPSTDLRNLFDSFIACSGTKYILSTFFTVPMETCLLSFGEHFLPELTSNFIIGCSWSQALLAAESKAPLSRSERFTARHRKWSFQKMKLFQNLKIFCAAQLIFYPPKHSWSIV